MKKMILLLVLILTQMSFGQSQNLEWKPFTTELGFNVSNILQDSLGRLITMSEKGVFIYTDSINIKRIDNFLPDSVLISCIAVDTKNNVYAGTFKNGVFKFNESNNTWEDISKGLDNKEIVAIAISDSNDVCVSSNYEYVWIKRAKEETFIKFFEYMKRQNSFYYFLYCINNELFMFGAKNGDGYEIEKKNIITNKRDYSNWGRNTYNNVIKLQNKLYFSTNNSHIKVCSENNFSFTDLYAGLENSFRLIRIKATNENELIVLSTTDGVFYSNNYGYSFQQNNIGLPNVNGLELIILKNEKVLCSIDSLGLFISDKPKNLPIEYDGWEEKGNYKERKAYNGASKYIKYSIDSKKIFTFQGSELKVWNVESGKLLKQKKFGPFESQYFPTISSDDSTIIFLCYQHSPGNYSIYCDIYNITNDSLLFKQYLFKNEAYCNNGGQDELTLGKSDYDFKEKMLRVSYNRHLVCDGSTRYEYSYGRYYQFYVSKDTNYLIFKNGLGNLNFLYVGDNKYIFHTNNSSSSFSNWFPPNTSALEASLMLYDFSINYSKFWYNVGYSNKDYNNIIIRSIKHRKNYNQICGLKRNGVLLFWDLNSYDLIDSSFINQIHTDYYTEALDFQLSADENKIISANVNHIKIIAIPSGKILDSIFIPINEYFWKIAVAPNGQSFATISSDGKLRLFKSPALTDVIESKNTYTTGISISPNPASDYIEISLSSSPSNKRGQGDVSFEIYNIFGESLPPRLTSSDTPPYEGGEKIRIHISNLPKGVYFIKIGDRFEKFVKL